MRVSATKKKKESKLILLSSNKNNLIKINDKLEREKQIIERKFRGVRDRLGTILNFGLARQ